MKFCPYCGAKYGDDIAACVTDGHLLENRPRKPRESWRETVNALFSQGELRGEKLIEICNALAGVNANASEMTFGIERAAKITFRGQEVCLVLGDVGSLANPSETTGGWSANKSVYALAESRDQMTWMRTNSDAFSPSSKHPDFPVFWVNLDIIHEEKASD